AAPVAHHSGTAVPGGQGHRGEGGAGPRERGAGTDRSRQGRIRRPPMRDRYGSARRAGASWGAGPGRVSAGVRPFGVGGSAPAPPPADSGRVTHAQLRAAAASDPVAFRAFWKIYGMTCLPDEVYTDPHVVACTRQAIRRQEGGPTVPQPAREILLAALGSNGQSSWRLPCR